MGLELMNIQPDAIILEIGFGNGRLISALAKKLDTGRIIGIDISQEMILEAEKKNAAFIPTGKVELHHSSVEKISMEDDYFDKIVTANTIYFWPDLSNNINEIYRTLKSGGQFYCALRPEEEMKDNGIVKTNRSIFKHLFSTLFKGAYPSLSRGIGIYGRSSSRTKRQTFHQFGRDWHQ
ncbi:MAG: class I SAM-dependent methyltransferase [Saprospiraceae bacterium]|nr:class I SAM-dependent methyltransferase [Saprospiraceae bacterium]